MQNATTTEYCPTQIRRILFAIGSFLLEKNKTRPTHSKENQNSGRSVIQLGLVRWNFDTCEHNTHSSNIFPEVEKLMIKILRGWRSAYPLAASKTRNPNGEFQSMPMENDAASKDHIVRASTTPNAILIQFACSQSIIFATLSTINLIYKLRSKKEEMRSSINTLSSNPRGTCRSSGKSNNS